MKVRKRVALLASAAVVALVAAACGGSDETPGGEGQTRSGGTLIYGFETPFMENWFPSIAAGNSVATAYAIIRVLPSPTKYTPTFEVVPDLELLTEAPKSEMLNGKQVVTYKLNPAAVWSDGDPLDAKDFKYSWEVQRSSDPEKDGCPDLLSTTGYDQVASVEGSDNDKTVKVTFATPYSDWLSLYNQQLFPAHIMDKPTPAEDCATIKKGWPVKDGVPVSAGPWKIEAANVDVSKKIATLTVNERYWGKKPNLDRLVYQNIGNVPGTNVKALKSGEVGMIYPQPQVDLVTEIKALEPQITSKTSFGLSFEHLDMNTRNVHLKDINVRKAIATALDRPSLVAATVGQFDNRAQVLNNRFYVNNQKEYADNSADGYTKGDVAKAKTMLEGAGYTLGSDGIYTKAGAGKLSLELMTTQNNPLRENTVDIIASQLKGVGIEIKKFLNADIFAGREKPKSLEAGGFDLALFAWVSSPFVAGNVSIYKSATAAAPGQNYVLGNNPKVDDALASMTQQTVPAEQAALANEADTLLWADMFTLPLYQKPTFLAYNSDYTGVAENSTNSSPMWNSEGFAKKT